MNSSALLRVLTLGAAVAMASGACGPAASPAPASPSPEYQAAYQTGLDAYVYGLPLLTLDATFRTMTSISVSSGAFGPVNQFHHVRGTNTAASGAVVAPGATGLSSIAWLDLRAEPQVLHVPAVPDHFFVLALLDPYTENVANFGSVANTPAGDYVIAGPGQHDAAVPAGAHRVNVDQTRIWIVGSTQLRGPDDTAAVNAIQDQFGLRPLSQAGTGQGAGGEATPTPAASPASSAPAVTKATIPTGIAYFDALGALLADFPPPAADAPALAAFAAVGIGPGRTPSADPALGADARRGLADAVAAGPARVKADIAAVAAASAPKHNGYLLGGFGAYGTDYRLRAVISQIGLGAFLPAEAIYALAWSDAAGAKLDGTASYLLHLPAAPPSDVGWSLTLYTLKGTLIANPVNRYALTSSSALTRNADGSIDIHLGPTAPADPALAVNWLPTAAGEGFEVIWRVFAPTASAIPGILDGSGWQPPAITAAP